jgi:dienelactone hydrolase
MRYSICLFINIFLLWGCHAKPSSKESEASKHLGALLKPLRKGVVIDSVFCADDSSQIYSIYLPTKYDTLKKWPIIYLFDPHGVGNLPVRLYKDLAEKYGFILAGTYNSKNGMQFANSDKAAQALMKDAWMRLSLDNNRLYTCGFSGGAMVAAMVAVSDGGIAGVVSCGGSFPQDQQLKQPFSYISFVGDKDFHYAGVKQLDRLLDSTSLAHQFIVFNGKHQWPPAASIEQAFQWLDVDAMRMKTMPKNDSIVKAIKEQFAGEAEAYHAKQNTVEEYYTYKKLVNYLHNLDDISQYTSKMHELGNSEMLKKYFKNEEAFDAQESQEIADFQPHLSQMEQAWWENKIADMKKSIEKDTTSPKALQTERMLGYLSLVMYMSASGQLTAHNYLAASYFVGLYALVDPTNPEHSYLSASLDMIVNHNSAQALEMLQNAVKLGFTDLKRLQADSNFVTLRNTPEYKKIVDEMTANPAELDVTK